MVRPRNEIRTRDGRSKGRDTVRKTTTPPLNNSLSAAENVVPPSYYQTGDPGSGPYTIDIKSAEEQELTRKSCRLARDILRQCEKVTGGVKVTGRVNLQITS